MTCPATCGHHPYVAPKEDALIEVGGEIESAFRSSCSLSGPCACMCESKSLKRTSKRSCQASVPASTNRSRSRERYGRIREHFEENGQQHRRAGYDAKWGKTKMSRANVERVISSSSSKALMQRQDS